MSRFNSLSRGLMEPLTGTELVTTNWVGLSFGPSVSSFNNMGYRTLGWLEKRSSLEVQKIYTVTFQKRVHIEML